MYFDIHYQNSINYKIHKVKSDGRHADDSKVTLGFCNLYRQVLVLVVALKLPLLHSSFKNIVETNVYTARYLYQNGSSLHPIFHTIILKIFPYALYNHVKTVPITGGSPRNQSMNNFL